MSTALVLVYGRSQQMPRERRGESDRVAAHVAAKKRSWLAGLTKGLVLARQAPINEGQMYFAFYGNTFAGLIEDPSETVASDRNSSSRTRSRYRTGARPRGRRPARLRARGGAVLHEPGATIATVSF